MVQGHQRQEEEEDRGVEEVVVVEGEEEDLQKPTVEPEELEGLEEQGLKRNNQSIHLFISRDTTFPKKNHQKRCKPQQSSCNYLICVSKLEMNQ